MLSSIWRVSHTKGRLPKVSAVVDGRLKNVNLNIPFDMILPMTQRGRYLAILIVRQAEKEQGMRFDSYCDGNSTVWFNPTKLKYLK